MLFIAYFRIQTYTEIKGYIMKRKLFFTLLLSFFLFFQISCSNSNSNDISSIPIPIDVIILAGQSNATGYARSDQLINYLSPDEFMMLLKGFEKQKIISHQDNTIYSIPPSFISLTNIRLGQGVNASCFGLEIGLSYILNKGQKSIIILKYTSPGNIINFFVNEKGLNSSFSDFLDTSLQSIKKQGYSPTIKALCWMQGESDSIYYISSINYKKNLEFLISNIRTKYGENISLIDAPITEWDLCYPVNYQSLVNEAKMSVSLSNPNNYLIDPTGLKKAPYDPTHYDAISEFELGKRMGNVLLRIIEE